MDALLQWMEEESELLAAVAVASLVLLVLSALLLPVVLRRIPADYFVDPEPYVTSAARRHPVLRLVSRVLRNVFGVVLTLAGIAMLVLPGQGLITLAAGLILLDFPGKRAFERRIIARPRVLAALNWLRAKAGAPALRAPRRRARATDVAPEPADEVR